VKGDIRIVKGELESLPGLPDFLKEKSEKYRRMYKVLKELLETQRLNQLLKDFQKMVNVSAAIIDLDGNVLAASSWQHLCTDFHRINPDTCERCIESDTELANQLEAGSNFTIYSCKNGLTDCASPIIIEDEHIANLFIGQFLLSMPDIEFFKKQAGEFDFPVKDYMAALEEVPVVDESRVSAIMAFLVHFSELVAAMGLEKLHAQQLTLAARFGRIVENSLNEVYVFDCKTLKFILVNHGARSNLGYSMSELQKLTLLDINPEFTHETFAEFTSSLHHGEVNVLVIETVLQRKDRSLYDVEVHLQLMHDEIPPVFSAIIQDITERKQSEETLRDSEAKFRTMFEASRDATMMLDRSGFFDCTQTTLDLFGCDTKEQFICKHPAELSPPTQSDGSDSFTAALQRIETAYKMGSNFFEWQHQRLDGTIFPAEVQLNRFEFQGKTVLQAIVRDITARKQAEEASAFQVRRAEAMLKLPMLAEKLDEASLLQKGQELLENLTVSKISFVYFVNNNTQNIELAASSCHTLELDCPAGNIDTHYPCNQDGVLADTLCQCKPLVFNDYKTKPDKCTLAESHSRLNRLICLPVIEHGKVVMLTIVGNKTFDYNELDIETAQLISNDIWHLVQRRRSELELRKLSLAIEQSPESIIICNTRAEIEYVNKSFVRATGYSYDEVIGHKPGILQSGNTSPETFSEIRSKLDKGEPWKGEFCNQHKDGSEYIELTIINPLRQKDGVISHYVVLNEDITEKKRLGEELDRYRHHLEEQVMLRTREMQVAQQQAEAANKAKSSFLSNMSHEIRTPMNAILGLTHLLQKNEHNTTQIERLNKINSAGEHLLSLINDILDLSKIEAGKLELELNNFNLDRLFKSIQCLLNEQFRRKGLTFEVAPFDFSPWLVGDVTRLRQALLNYLSNAIKFTQSGKVTLRVKKIKDQGDKQLLHFDVEDTGMGINPDNLKQLFHCFEQADDSTTRQFGGTGLGLSITRRIAHLMGGDAGAHSKLNQGSIFWFSGWFSYGREDLSLSTAINSKELETTLRNHYAGAHILLVEDNDINSEVAKGLLADVGMLVDIAVNGREAVEKAKTLSCDLILMDIQMPVMDGLEATRKIRASEEKINFPILAMTAGVLDNEKQACFAAGMDGFVAKPIELQDFYSILIKWLPERSVPLERPSESITKAIEAEPATLLKEPLASLEGVDTSIGLANVQGDSVTYLRLLRLFDTIHAEDINKFRQYLSQDNVDQAKQLAHTIKGASGTLGLTQLQESAALFEANLKSHSHTMPDKQTARLLDTLTAEYSHFHQALMDIEDNESSAPVAGVGFSEARVILEHLEKLLKVDDVAANTLFLDSEQLLQQAYGSQATLLGQQIESFDYHVALHTLKSIINTLK